MFYKIHKEDQDIMQEELLYTFYMRIMGYLYKNQLHLMYSVVSRTHDLHGWIGRDFLQLSTLLLPISKQTSVPHLATSFSSPYPFFAKKPSSA